MTVTPTQAVSNSVASGTSVTLTIATPGAGHLLVIGHYSGGTATPAAPSGWNIAKQSSGTTAGKASVYWRIADGTEGTSVAPNTGATAVFQAATFVELDAGYAWVIAPVDSAAVGETSPAATTSFSLTADAAISQLDEIVVCLVGLAATATFANTWTNGFARVGSVAGSRFEMALKETSVIETPSTAEGWTTSTAPRVAMQSFLVLPATPTGLTATPVSDTQVHLSWTAVSGVSTYGIFRDGTQIATGVSGTTYDDTGLNPSTTYGYQVRSEA